MVSNDKGELMDIQQIIISEIQKLTKAQVQVDSQIRDLKIDSLDLVQLVVDAESKFNISIDDEEITKIEKVSDFIEIVKEKSK